MKAIKIFALNFLALILLVAGGRDVGAEEIKELTVDSAVSIALEENLNLKLLKSDIDKGQAVLQVRSRE
jgi:hypothetical protein